MNRHVKNISSLLSAITITLFSTHAYAENAVLRAAPYYDSNELITMVNLGENKFECRLVNLSTNPSTILKCPPPLVNSITPDDNMLQLSYNIMGGGGKFFSIWHEDGHFDAAFPIPNGNSGIKEAQITSLQPYENITGIAPLENGFIAIGTEGLVVISTSNDPLRPWVKQPSISTKDDLVSVASNGENAAVVLSYDKRNKNTTIRTTNDGGKTWEILRKLAMYSAPQKVIFNSTLKKFVLVINDQFSQPSTNDIYSIEPNGIILKHPLNNYNFIDIAATTDGYIGILPNGHYVLIKSDFTIDGAEMIPNHPIKGLASVNGKVLGLADDNDGGNYICPFSENNGILKPICTKLQ